MRIRDNRWYGCRRDTKDWLDRLFTMTATHLPPQVDLRSNCPPVMDQGELGSCTAHGITGALRHLLLSTGRADYPLSRLWVYYQERKVEGTIGEDAGAEIRDGIKVIAALGAAHETLWPYDIAKFKDAPPADVGLDAHLFRALVYERVTVSVSGLKHALALGFPVIIGLSLHESFESDAVARTGFVPYPKRGEQMIGGHCMYVVGYVTINGQEYFIVRNSWGADWGAGGDCYFPPSVLGSRMFGSDYWVVRQAGQ